MIGRLVVLLIVANVAWAAWSQGWLRGMGWGPAEQREPERVERQVRPETLTVQPLPGDQAGPRPNPPAPAPQPAQSESPASAVAPAVAAPASAAVAAAAEPAVPAPSGTCLEAGLFDDKQIEAVRRAAANLPSGSWRVDQVALPGRWMVYVGKLADADALATKRAELRALGVDTDRAGGTHEPGLSLGRFSSEDQADRALADLNRKGVKTARVVQERRDTPAFKLRLPNADPALRQQARSLRGALGGKELRSCE